ncbi:MAG: hypothetical protein IJ716_14640 [Lachnospiraceae bacterium]|nr:hypothetical protein [Lachnospiraceae bacterium]
MSTTTRPELSPKNKYWIERHRYYELKHFCMQYPIWKKLKEAIDVYRSSAPKEAFAPVSDISDPTARCAEARMYYTNRMLMVETVTRMADPEIHEYLLKGVTEGYSYDILKARLDIPCSKDTYYDAYRRFFWLLDKERE